MTTTAVSYPDDPDDDARADGWQATPLDLEPVPDGPSAIHGDRDAARVVTRVQRAAELRLMRMSWQQVADRTGYASRGAAYTAVMGYLRRQTDETISELREQESASYDRAALALWPKVLAGDARAQDTWLRNRASFRVLWGLNAPVQVTLSSGAQAAMHDALAEVEALLLSQTTPGEVIESREGWDDDGSGLDG